MTFHTDSLYDQCYAEAYEGYYLHPWARKHALNVQIIEALLRASSQKRPCWLDLCCGQGWHFAQVEAGCQKTGIDLSSEQLTRARLRNPQAKFLTGNVLSVDLPANRFDLVTCFWAAYCYLGSISKIGRFLDRAIAWTRLGGSLYFEILLPSDLLSFNDSEFAQSTGFRVTHAALGDPQWTYEDHGGSHRMVSPPLSFFEARLAPYFAHVTAKHDGGFMTHLCATGRCATEEEGIVQTFSPEGSDIKWRNRN